MKSKLFTLFVFTFLLLGLFSGMASALTPPTGGVAYWNLSSFTNLWGANTLTNDGTVSDTTFPIFAISGNSGPSSSIFDTATDSIITNYIPINNKNITYTMWIKITSFNSVDLFIEERNGSSSNSGHYCYLDAGSQRVICNQGNGGGSTIFSITSNRTIPLNVWNLITLTDKGNIGTDVVYLYFNKTRVGKASRSTLLTVPNSVPVIFGSLNSGGSGNNFNGYMDNIKIYNKSLSIQEIENEYNYGNINGIGSNATITAKSTYNSSSILSYSVNITNGTHSYTKYTNTGTITTLINSTMATKNKWNITFWNNSNHFNKQQLNYNFSSHSNTIQMNVTRSFTYINLKNYYNTSETLTPFNVTVNSITYLAATKNTKIYLQDNNLNDIQIRKANYFNVTLDNKNTSANYTAYAKPFFYYFSLNYSNYRNFDSKNYTRTLNYSLNVSCKSGTYFTLYENGVPLYLQMLTCYNTSHEYGYTYQSSTEGKKNISLKIVSTDLYSEFKGNRSFYFDLVNPTIIKLYVLNNTFSRKLNTSLTCVDNIFPSLNYTKILSGTILLNGKNYSNNTLKKNVTSMTSNTVWLYNKCADLFGSTVKNESIVSYYSEIFLIDEKTGIDFDVDYVSGARLYYSNGSYYDFKLLNKSAVNLSSLNSTKFWVDLLYADGTSILRMFDMSLVGNSVRVCANRQNITHYPQQLISSSEKVVLMKNVFSNCYIAGDYTRFAYQDSLLLNAYSISSLYYLNTFDNGVEVLLASVDGSNSQYINLDTLEFSKQAYSTKLSGSAFTFEKTAPFQILILYNNTEDDDSAVNLKIYKLDNTSKTLVFDYSGFTDPNEFVIYFDYSTLNVTNMTFFELVLTKTKTDGSTDTQKMYLSPNAKSGILKDKLAFILAILLTIFGLTIVAPRIALSWFGIILELMSILVLSLAVGTEWYINFMVFMDMVIIVFSFILITRQSPTTVSN